MPAERLLASLVAVLVAQMMIRLLSIALDRLDPEISNDTSTRESNSPHLSSPSMTSLFDDWSLIKVLGHSVWNSNIF